MRLTVLGASGSFASAHGACSGYLVRTDTTAVLLDAGNGSTVNLHRELDLVDLDAVVVSHRHADHCVDLVGLRHASRALGLDRAIPLYAAEGVVEAIAALTGHADVEALDDAFEIHAARPGDVIEVGDVRITLFPSLHPVPTVSMRLEADGTVLTYSADSAGGDALVEAARGADLLLCEATWQGDADDYPVGIHLTARDAGRIATVAGARRLLLTHVAGHLDRDVSRAEAAETFTGPVAVARDGDDLVVGGVE